MKTLIKYACIWLLLNLFTIGPISRLIGANQSDNVGSAIILINTIALFIIIKFKSKFTAFSKRKEKVQIQNNEIEPTEIKPSLIPKGDTVKFEYETDTSSETKFFSGKLIDIEFDSDEEWGTHAVLIGETANGTVKKFKDYDLLGDVVYKGKKYASFEDLYSKINND
ncbi:hypothetical protein HYE54_03485 [Aggregatibacter actinomycetemcomitans]|uniref:hypothetical protein n=1 Tax=Aggregatibacter actinomycetemcomitans TaxID=714 RepID=UPI00197BF7CB|nr:hypothetical protein [Aggregatibacter actinomycetemcomitans]MBN6067848.1 hypothetical protein [Aggregatibacter actinomycetemcomitans]MBN6085785.1 hypothetical protein [Aggregatibacter actinomycetemcomitans]